jgi:hypothetical protein
VESRAWWLGGVAVGLGVIALSQPWTGFNSPDSEFYASFALYGADIADRAVEPAYYWTRLGYIAPVRALVSILGPWWGFGLWRALLIIMIVAAVMIVARKTGRSLVLATGLALFVGLNTVVLAYVGNTYLSGTIIAVTFLLLSLGVSYLSVSGARETELDGRPRWTIAAGSGLLLGWLLMLNPYALTLGLGMWLSIRFLVVWAVPTRRWQRLGIDALAGLTGTLVGFGVFWLAGLVIFPGRDWWGTYLEWNTRLDYTDFIGDATTWQRDTALIVVVLAIVASLVATVGHRRNWWAWAALVISVTNVLVTVVLMAVMPGPWLEAPHYVALLWPGALLSLALVFISLSPGHSEGRASYPWVYAAGIAITVPLIMWAGRFDGVLPLGVAWAIAGILVLALGLVAWLVRGRWNAVVAGALVVVMGAVFVSAQVWQNGRGLLGIYSQYPFRSAFVDFQFDDQFASRMDIQKWLLARTTRDDSIAIWADPAGLGREVAAMQMWGDYNLSTQEAQLSRETTTRLEQMRPTAVAMYAPDREQIEGFYASLPPWSLPSDLECTAAPYLGVGSGEIVACLTRLTWVG